MKTSCYIIGVILSIVGCKEPKFSSSEFVGIWKSDDKASITINQDGTCVLKDVNKSIVSITQSDNEKLTTKGTWKKVDNINSGITGGISTGIKITYNLTEREGTGSVVFYISGQGYSGNKPPWELFIWNGDPDEMIKYKFSKETAK